MNSKEDRAGEIAARFSRSARPVADLEEGIGPEPTLLV
jgi:hypothetical protein